MYRSDVCHIASTLGGLRPACGDGREEMVLLHTPQPTWWQGLLMRRPTRAVNSTLQ